VVSDDSIFFDLSTDKSSTGKGKQMARKPNYGFEKRQKELARKAKKEEKNKRKQEESGEETAEETPEQD